MSDTHMHPACATCTCDPLMHERTNELTHAETPKTREESRVGNAHERQPELNPLDMSLRAARANEGQPPVPTGRCCVYFLWSADWRLLYVGVTGSPERRFTQHRRYKPWWSEVHHMEVEEYASRARAFAREREAIVGWDPLHNLKLKVTRP